MIVGSKLVLVDRLGWPIEQFRNRPVINFIRRLLHGRRWARWYLDENGGMWSSPNAPRPGWVLVPIEPTEAMKLAALHASDPVIGFNILRIYRAMLAARPSAPPICASTQNDETPHASHTTSLPADRWNEAIEAAAKVAESAWHLLGIGEVMAGAEIASTIRALATPPVKRADGWQSIETAPKDGTHVIVGTFPEPAGQITTTVAHWFDSRDFGAKSGGAGWALSINYDGEHSDHGVQVPTHWRPLPTPPQTGNGR